MFSGIVRVTFCPFVLFDSSSSAEESQRLRRQKRSERLANQDGDSDGSEEWDSRGVFGRGCKPEAALGSGGSEGSMRDAMQFKYDNQSVSVVTNLLIVSMNCKC